MIHLLSIFPVAAGYTGLLAAPPRVSTAQAMTYLTIALTGITLFAGMIWLVNRLAHRWRFESHAGLFHGLCRAHELSHGNRRLLKQIARYYRLRQFGRLFTDPDLLDSTRLGQSLRSQAHKLAKLRARLFESPAPEEESSSSEPLAPVASSTTPADAPSDADVETTADATAETTVETTTDALDAEL